MGGGGKDGVLRKVGAVLQRNKDNVVVRQARWWATVTFPFVDPVSWRSHFPIGDGEAVLGAFQLR